MPATDLPDRVWYVQDWTPEIDRVVRASGSGIRPMAVVPLIVVPADHPLADDPPRGAEVSPLEREDDLAIAGFIDRFLLECRAFLEPARGGNDWVTTPGYPFFDRETDLLTMGFGAIPSVERGYPVSLSLSLQLAPRASLHPQSPIAVATAEAVRWVPVFVAVGNYGSLRDEGDTYDLRSPLSRLPGVISVGATIDEDGSALTRSSSVGAAGGSGPTLVAHGENTFEPGVNQSSFATPRAASLAAFIAAFLLQVRAAMRAVHLGTPQGVPLALMGLIDQGFFEFDPSQAFAAPMIPFGYGIDEDSCRAATLRARDHGVALTVAPNPGLVTSLLIRSASPGPGRPHESGAGTVTYAGTAAMLEALTWRELLSAAGHELPTDAVFDTRMAEPQSLSSLYTLTMRSRLVYGMDFRNGWMDATVRPPSMS